MARQLSGIYQQATYGNCRVSINENDVLASHIRYYPPFFGLQHGLLSAPPALRRPRHWLTCGKSRLRPTARHFPKRHNSLAPAIPHWGVACHYSPGIGVSEDMLAKRWGVPLVMSSAIHSALLMLLLIEKAV